MSVPNGHRSIVIAVSQSVVKGPSRIAAGRDHITLFPRRSTAYWRRAGCLSSPALRAGAEKDKRSRSRDAVFCIRGLRHGTGKNDAQRNRVTPKFFQDRAVGPASARSRLAHVSRMSEAKSGSKKKKIKKKQAERRQTPPHQSAPCGMRRAPSGARCAYRRSTTALMAANQRRHSAPERASWDATSADVTPPPSIPV